MVDVLVPHRRYVMTLGPVQLMVVGLHGEDDDFNGKVPQALHAAHVLRGAHQQEDVRVLDLLLIRKDAHGNIQRLQISELGERERAFAGALAGGLLGLRADSDMTARPGTSYGVLTVARQEFGLSEADLREIVRDIPNGHAAAIVLVEHLWVIRLKEVFEDVGCTLLAEGMLTPRMLGGFGADVATAQTAADNDFMH